MELALSTRMQGVKNNSERKGLSFASGARESTAGPAHFIFLNKISSSIMTAEITRHPHCKISSPTVYTISAGNNKLG